MRALDALVVATDVYGWKMLRRDLERSPAATARTMKCLIRATLEALSTPHPSGE
jgi:hypothetical protein